MLFSKSVDTSFIYDDDETTYYNIVQCAGCDKVSYRTEVVDTSQPYIDEAGEWQPTVTVECFPMVLKNHQTKIRKFQIPAKISTVYSEAINAFSAGCYLLTGVAFRAVIEAICKDKNVAGRDLNAMINNLAKSKLITEKEAERLHPIRFIGNDSVHEMAVPSTDALYIVLNVVEHLLNNLYIIDERIKNKLETVINNFEDFRILLSKSLEKYTEGDEMTLKDLLGKSYRRLHNRVYEFETELQKQIEEGVYKKLSKGDVIPNVDPKKIIQKYILEKRTINDELDL